MLDARLGWRNAALLGLVLGMAMLLPFGRQTNLNIGDPDDTFQRKACFCGANPWTYSGPRR